MADLAPHERLMPFLLDRLTDDDPATRMESREKRSVSFRHFQKAILRDLTWLLNTPTKTEDEHLEEFAEVGRSVLNYGMPDFTGLTHSDITPAQIERAMRNAILQFEPRIIRETLVIRVVQNTNAAGNTLYVEIQGQVYAQPIPESLFVKTEVDLETGVCNLSDQLHG